MSVTVMTHEPTRLKGQIVLCFLRRKLQFDSSSAERRPEKMDIL